MIRLLELESTAFPLHSMARLAIFGFPLGKNCGQYPVPDTFFGITSVEVPSELS